MDNLIGQNVKNFARLAFCAVLLGLSACYSGFDYSALDLNRDNMSDYLDLAREKKIEPGTVEYALLSSSPGSSEIIRQMDEIDKDIAKQIDALDKLGQKFSGQELERHKQWIHEIKDLANKIPPLTAVADKSYKTAYDLVDFVAKVNSEFLKNLAQYAEKIPPDAKEALALHGENLTKAFKLLYQQSMLLAQSVPQREALDIIAKIDTPLKSMIFNLEKNSRIMAASNIANAKKALVEADQALEGVRKAIAKMTTKDLAHNELKASANRLRALLDNVDTHYVKNVENANVGKAPEEARKLQNQINTAQTDFESALTHFEANDKLKNPSDEKLKPYVEEAFSSATVLAAPISLQINTDRNDLVRLIKDLKENTIIGLKRAEDSRELMKALAIAVDKKIALHHDLKLNKIIAINDESLNTIRHKFGMTDQEFGEYTQAQVEKILKAESSPEHFPNVYIVYADELGKGADIDQIVATLSEGPDKVIVIANNNEKYGKPFIADGLDLASGYYVARAVVKDRYPHDRINEIVEPLVKIFYALSKKSQMNLVSLPSVALSAVQRLRISNKTFVEAAKEALEAVEQALASMKDPIPTQLVNQSGVLGDSLSTVEENMQKDRTYYRSKGY